MGRDDNRVDELVSNPALRYALEDDEYELASGTSNAEYGSERTELGAPAEEFFDDDTGDLQYLKGD